MKPGKEYELFIFEKFKSLFRDFDVNVNDKILGQQSQIKREIDVSIKGKLGNVEFLYLVQCKDHNKPADVKIIGEFSAVIKDVGASKGFLICSSGFAKTIHTYAKSLGIELITIEDINSAKWSVDIQIPIIYIYKNFEISYHAKILANEALVARNKTDILITPKDFETVSLDNHQTTMKVVDYLNMVIENNNIDVEKETKLELTDPNLQLLFADVWVNLKLEVEFETEPKYYLKYVTPDEYSQISDHLNNEKIPLKLKLNTNFQLDDSYIEIQKENAPVTSTVFLEVEENLRPISDLKFDMMDFNLKH